MPLKTFLQTLKKALKIRVWSLESLFRLGLSAFQVGSGVCMTARWQGDDSGDCSAFFTSFTPRPEGAKCGLKACARCKSGLVSSKRQLVEVPNAISGESFGVLNSLVAWRCVGRAGFDTPMLDLTHVLRVRMALREPPRWTGPGYEQIENLSITQSMVITHQ